MGRKWTINKFRFTAIADETFLQMKCKKLQLHVNFYRQIKWMAECDTLEKFHVNKLYVRIRNLLKVSTSHCKIDLK